MNIIRYAQIRPFDVANGTGIRTTLFVSGCTHHCKGCFNELYQDFSYGHPFTKVEEDAIIEFLMKPIVTGLTILGGEPLQQDEKLLQLVKRVKKTTQKSIWIYSGYTFEAIQSLPLAYDVMCSCDILVDGPYIEELKDLTLAFRGSSNQRIIDIQQTIQNKEIVLYNPRRV